ncbi:MAG: glycosyltransferase, partial [Candidatus Melainabacteria bacterium]|nr:glycosyltransferase [Candidatus Melainabacteria bacterium]
NFGQQLAITAGLKFSQGDYVVVIDCDLQDNPLYIPALYERSQEGFDVVYAKKVFRKYNLLRDIVTKMFYGFLGLVSAYKFDPNIGTFSLISRKVVNSFLKFNDYRRGYLMVLKWLGFKQGYVEVEHSTRHSGKSSYSFGKLLEHALKLTVAGSNKLLRFSIYIGIFFSAVAFIGIIFLVCRYFMIGYKEGWTSVMVMITLIGGIIMMLLGIVGLYISAIFDQVRNRPLFLVDKTENCSVES